MHPVLFRLGDFEITSFGVLVAVGALVGIWLFGRETARSGLPVRFAIEFFRVNLRVVGPLTLAHLISLSLVVAGVTMIVRNPQSGKAR